MSHLVRLTDYSITDFFIQQAENSCYCRNQFLKHILLFSSSPTRIAFTPLVSTRFTIPSICLKIGQHDVIFPGNQKVLTLPLSIAAHLLCVGRIFRDTHISQYFPQLVFHPFQKYFRTELFGFDLPSKPFSKHSLRKSDFCLVILTHRTDIYRHLTKSKTMLK